MFSKFVAASDVKMSSVSNAVDHSLNDKEGCETVSGGFCEHLRHLKVLLQHKEGKNTGEFCNAKLQVSYGFAKDCSGRTALGQRLLESCL